MSQAPRQALPCPGGSPFRGIETSRDNGLRIRAVQGYSADAAAMRARGMRFYLAGNGAWLTDAVPPEAISLARE